MKTRRSVAAEARRAVEKLTNYREIRWEDNNGNGPWPRQASRPCRGRRCSVGRELRDTAPRGRWMRGSGSGLRSGSMSVSVSLLVLVSGLESEQLVSVPGSVLGSDLESMSGLEQLMRMRVALIGSPVLMPSLPIEVEQARLQFLCLVPELRLGPARGQRRLGGPLKAFIMSCVSTLVAACWVGEKDGSAREERNPPSLYVSMYQSYFHSAFCNCLSCNHQCSKKMNLVDS